MCDRIALMQDGQFMKLDTPEQIIRDYKQVLWAVQADEMSRLLKDLRKNEHVHTCHAFGDSHHVTIATLDLENQQVYTEEELEKYLKNNGHTNIEITAVSASIEDCFMELIV